MEDRYIFKPLSILLACWSLVWIILGFSVNAFILIQTTIALDLQIILFYLFRNKIKISAGIFGGMKFALQVCTIQIISGILTYPILKSIPETLELIIAYLITDILILFFALGLMYIINKK